MDESFAPDLWYLVGVRLLAVQVPNPDQVCEFYKDQFELEVGGKDSDGTVTLLLTTSQVRPKKGVQSFGIQVSDLAGLEKHLQDGGVTLSESTADQIRFNDPEGKRVIVSDQAWN